MDLNRIYAKCRETLGGFFAIFKMVIGEIQYHMSTDLKAIFFNLQNGIQKFCQSMPSSDFPECIREDYLEALLSVKKEYHVNISIELGLQTVTIIHSGKSEEGILWQNFLMPFCRLKNMALRSVLM